MVEMSYNFARVAASALLVLVAIAAVYGDPQPTDSGGAHGGRPIAASRAGGNGLPSIEAMIEARTDVWGNAARRQPNGASYEFFKDLLPPLRWVNTEFRHYPIVLSAPRSSHKTRLVIQWQRRECAGQQAAHVVRARCARHVLRGRFPRSVWSRSGAPRRPALSRWLSSGRHVAYRRTTAPFIGRRRLRLSMSASARVSALPGCDFRSLRTASVPLPIRRGGSSLASIQLAAACREEHVLNEQSQQLVAFGPLWQWDGERQQLAADLHAGQDAELTIYTQPGDKAPPSPTDSMTNSANALQRGKTMLDRGIHLETPETDRQRRLAGDCSIGNFMMAVGDRLHYSAGNAYAQAL